MTSRTTRLAALAAGAVAVAAAAAAAAVASPGVAPPTYAATLAPGDSATVTKTVTTPAVAPKVDVYFLADTTGSMGGAISNVKANAAAILAAVDAASPDARYGAGDYKDFPYDVYAFQNAAPIASTDDGGAAATAAIMGWSAGGGSDWPEGQFFALKQLASPTAASFDASWRPGSTRIVVWFGDAPAHDPVCPSVSGLAAPITEASVTADLVAAGIKVLAVSTPTLFPAALDDDPTAFAGDYGAGCPAGGTAGQATRLAAATGGLHLVAPSPSDVAAVIIAGLTNLPMTVTPAADCDAELSVSFSPASQTVTSGSAATFSETITVGPGAGPGTYECTVDFLLDGNPAAGFSQTVTITVEDTTAPAVRCAETTNPGGGTVPKAGTSAGRSGQNPDGFYVLTASDDFDAAPAIYVGDTGSSAVFGAFAGGTRIKLTQAPGATPSQKPGAGAIAWHITLKGEAKVWAVDAAGNASAPVLCRVAPLPK